MTEATFSEMVNFLGESKETIYMSEINQALKDVAKKIGDVPFLETNLSDKHSKDPYTVQTGTWFPSADIPEIDNSELIF